MESCIIQLWGFFVFPKSSCIRNITFKFIYFWYLGGVVFSMRIVPQGLWYWSTRSLIGGSVWGGFRAGALLKEVHHWAWALRACRLAPLPVGALRFLLKMWSLSFLVCLLPHLHSLIDSSFCNHEPISTFSHRWLLVVVFDHSNWKVMSTRGNWGSIRWWWGPCGGTL